MRIVGLISIAVILAGCSSTSAPSASAGEPPQNYRAAATQAVKGAFFDPYSVRDASISAPFYASMVFDGASPFPSSGWAVCLKANAKNRMGGYIGSQPTLFLFSGETISKTLQGPEFSGQLQDHCDKQTYQPFPELEGPA